MLIDDDRRVVRFSGVECGGACLEFLALTADLADWGLLVACGKEARRFAFALECEGNDLALAHRDHGQRGQMKIR